MMHRFVIGIVPLCIAASCGGVISDNDDASGDAALDAVAAKKCNTAHDCPAGYECAYSKYGGCQAIRQCFPPAPDCKKLVTSCSCNLDQMIDGDCNDAFQEPVTGALCPHDCATAGIACEICDVTGFSPTSQKQPEYATQSCSSWELATFVSACLESWTTKETCDTWKQTADAGAACMACLFTQASATTWGPLVCDAQGCVLNTGGCIDLFEGQVVLEKSNGGAGSCGDLVRDRNGCLDYACASCEAPNKVACGDNALASQCKSYEDAVTTSKLCKNIATNDGVCVPAVTSEYNAFVKLFCGTGL